MTQPARILFVTQEYSAVSAGGVGVYAYELAKALSDAGAIVHVLAPGSHTYDETINDHLTVHWVRTINKPLLHIPSFHIQVWRNARRLIRQYQLTSLHSNENAGLTALGLLPSVATIHHPIAAELHHNTFWQRLINYPDVMMEHVIVRRIPHIIVPSHTVQELFQHRYPFAMKKVEVILNGIDVKRYQAGQNNSILDRYHLPANRPRIFYPGGCRAKRKGALNVIAALSAGQFSQRPIVIMSGTSRETGWETELKQAIRAHNLNDLFVWAGEIDYQDLPAYFHATDITLYPSTFEGFGLPVLEGLACGRPVIASATGEAAYIVNDRNGVLVPAEHNISQLTAALELLVNQPDERKSRGKAAASTIAHSLDWSVVARQYIATHRQAVQK